MVKPPHGNRASLWGGVWDELVIHEHILDLRDHFIGHLVGKVGVEPGVTMEGGNRKNHIKVEISHFINDSTLQLISSFIHKNDSQSNLNIPSWLTSHHYPRHHPKDYVAMRTARRGPKTCLRGTCSATPARTWSHGRLTAEADAWKTGQMDGIHKWKRTNPLKTINIPDTARWGPYLRGRGHRPSDSDRAR